MAAASQTIHQVGKRKSSVARVYMKKGSGKIEVNGRTFEDFFPLETSRLIVQQPLVLTSNEGKWDIYLNVKGGGPSGQAGASRHAISKALLKVDTANRAILKKEGLITRDAREVERKKPGKAGARKRFQFSKR
jgi:small subunit ribosomal protein S9